MANSTQIQYLEIVTPEAEATCQALEKVHKVGFSEPIAGFGNARTASLAGGGRIGVRAPMHESEEPVVRPYVLVSDIDAALAAAGRLAQRLRWAPRTSPGRASLQSISWVGYTTAFGKPKQGSC